MSYFRVFIFLFVLTKVSLQIELNFVIYYEDLQKDLPFMTEDIFKELDPTDTISRNFQVFDHNAETEDLTCDFCRSLIDPSKFNIILDMLWFHTPRIREIAAAFAIPYFKIDSTIYPILEPVVEFIRARNGTESVFIMANEEHRNEALITLIQNAGLQVLVQNGLDYEAWQKIGNKRPIPEYNSIVATTEQMNVLFKIAIDNNLVRFPDRWNLMFLDSDVSAFEFKDSYPEVTKIVLDNSFYCQWFPQKRGTDCDWPKGPFNWIKPFLRTLFYDLVRFYTPSAYAYPQQMSSLCEGSFHLYPVEGDTLPELSSEMEYFNELHQHPVLFADQSNRIKFRLEASIFKATEDEFQETQLLGDFSSFTGKVSTIVPLTKTRRYFRIGTAFAIPWATYKLNPKTGNPMRRPNGDAIWEGYCIDFMRSLSLIMDFDFDIIEPESKTLGENINGVFNGAVGDLIRGETDIIIAPLTTTAEYEEVIDFVAPAYEETGISIVIRTPVRDVSLFQFMTVLKTEVWIIILISLIVSAILVWILDKYSPYSAQNRKYGFDCRYFSLKESFWFALTSYTPQGGGELPRCLSGRVLIATYWLFVVLILATFTANLAAYLTVEQTGAPVANLEQLGKQSRINFTVVEGSDTHKFFINMKFAEDTLYDYWKNISLDSTWDQYKFRVWDYPITEQFGSILRAINGSGPVKNAAEGFQNVMDHVDGDWAFIHDSQEVKLEMTRNCELIEIGEVFGRRPLAVAIQNGNHELADQITRAIMDLQKDRYFDGLTNKWWNASVGNCFQDENEGMTLESLGGVFLVTIFGLGIAIVSLIAEAIFMYKKSRDMTQPIEPADAGSEEGSAGSLRGVLKRHNMVGMGNEIEPGNAFGVHKRVVNIIEDEREG